MLVLEYTQKYSIAPTSLINDAPGIWRWTNPNIAIASWMLSVFGVAFEVDKTQRFNFRGAYINLTQAYTYVESYADMLITDNSCHWDGDNQIMYFNFGLINPHTFTSIGLLNVNGFTNTVTKIFNGVAYLPLLANFPEIRQESEPLIYSRASSSDVEFGLKNSDIVTIDSAGKPVKGWRFDSKQQISGMLTYFYYGSDDATYAELKLKHKGIIRDSSTGFKLFTIMAEDVRGTLDEEWPTYSWADAGYTSAEVDEDLLSQPIPDGFGLVFKYPGVCINRSAVEIQEDDDGVITLPDNDVSYDLGAWITSGVSVVETSKEIARFTMFSIDSSGSVANKLYTTFTATASLMKITGYLSTAEIYLTGTTGINIPGVGVIYVNIKAKIVAFNGVSNLRYKFINSGSSETYIYFSFEIAASIGTGYTIEILPDVAFTDRRIIYAAAIRVTEPVYPKFVFARSVDSITQVYYEEDNELKAIDYIAFYGDSISIHEVDAFVDGNITKSLRNIFATITLRTPYNPFDVIKFLNNERGTTYIDSYYNKSLCEAEAAKLADVGFILDKPQSTYKTIEQLQSGSSVGFRYEDIDKIIIRCDDPNRVPAFTIQKEWIGDITSSTWKDNRELFADEVTARWGYNNYKSKYQRYRNTDYADDVFARTLTRKPRSWDTLMTSLADAVSFTKIRLEDLSVIRGTITITVPLDYMPADDELFIFKILNAEISGKKDREFKGTRRMQVIGLVEDTRFNLIRITLRERQYSAIFEDITGSGSRFVIGEAVTPMVIGDEEYNLFFDGVDDYVVTDSNIPSMYDLSISVWFKWEDYGTDNVQFITSGFGEQIEIHTGGSAGVNGLKFMLNTHPASTLEITNAIPDNEWHNYTAVYTDNDSVIAYRDGNVIGSRTHTVTTPTTANVLYVGRRDSNEYYFKGFIKDTRIYSRAITPAEVLSLYEGTPVPSGLVSQWLLDEGAGTVAIDSAGANDGNIVGATWTKETEPIVIGGYDG